MTGKLKKLKITVESVSGGGFMIQVKRGLWNNKRFVAETLKRAKETVTEQMDAGFKSIIERR